MRIAIALACLAVLAAVAAVQPTPTDAERVQWRDCHVAGTRALGAGRFDEAVGCFEKALRTAEGFGQKDPCLSTSLLWLASALMRLERLKDAEPHLRRLIALPNAGPNHRGRVATAYRDLATICRTTSRLDEARDFQQQHLKLLGFRPKPVDLCDAFERLAWIEIERGNDDRAIRLLRQALRLREKMDASSREIVVVLYQMALIHQGADQLDEGEPLLVRALRIQDGERRGEEELTARVLASLAIVRTQAREFDEARALIGRAGWIRTKLHGAGHPSRATTEWELARIDRAQGRLAAARKRFESAIALLEKHLGASHESPLTARGEVAWLLVQMGRPTEAATYIRRLIEDGQPVFGEKSRWMAFRLGTLAGVMKDLGRLDEAIVIWTKALSLHESVFGAEHRETGVVCNNLGTAYRDRGRLDAAEKLFRRSYEIYGRDPRNPDAAYPLNSLARIARRRGRLEEAEKICLQALSLRLRILGPDDLAVAHSLETLAQIHRDQGRTDTALGAARRAVAIHGMREVNHPQLGEALSVLGSVLHRAGRTEEAARELARAESTMIEALGRENPRLLPTLERYAGVLRTLGRNEEAAARDAHAKEIRQKAEARAKRSEK